MIFKVQDDGIGMDGARHAQVCAMLRDEAGAGQERRQAASDCSVSTAAYPAQLWQEYGLKIQSTYGQGHRDLGADSVPGRRKSKENATFQKKITPFEENAGKIVNELFII